VHKQLYRGCENQRITCIGKEAALFIQPEVWNQDNYDEANGDPFNATPGGGTFDIKADDKPAVLEWTFRS
jgi:hypothetical protein